MFLRQLSLAGSRAVARAAAASSDCPCATLIAAAPTTRRALSSSARRAVAGTCSRASCQPPQSEGATSGVGGGRGGGGGGGGTTRRSEAPEKIPSTSIAVLRTVDAVRRWRRPLLQRETGRSVGLVPTMGALHAGHAALIRAAARDNTDVVVSVYVNPAQFGVREDLASYPVTWDRDAALLARLDRELADDGAPRGRIAAVFAPTTAEMYPSGFPGQEVDSKGSFVTITPVGERLEGASRPTFFRGVATVCMKLFNVVQPDRVYFGQKDVQQTVVVRRMVRDFLLPCDVVVVPTVREPDGLALSSRNVYLGARRRPVATVLSRALRAAEARYLERGDTARDDLLRAARRVVDAVLAEQAALPPARRVRFEVDYLSLADPDTMEEVDAVDASRGAVVSGAVKMLPVEAPQEGEDLGHSGGPAVRLIDNLILPPRHGAGE